MSVAKAIWQAWYEMNAIRARDGVPYQSAVGGGCQKADVQPEYWSQCVDDLEAAYLEITGLQIAPWSPDVQFKGKPERPMLKALRAYQQADSDGIMVLVSRQAIDEAVKILMPVVSPPPSCGVVE